MFSKPLSRARNGREPPNLKVVSAPTQAQLDDYIARLEEAEAKIRAAEAKIAEKDQRIVEVERLLGCMGKVEEICSTRQQQRSSSRQVKVLSMFLFNGLLFVKEKTQLETKLQECEQRLRLLELTDTTDSSVAKT